MIVQLKRGVSSVASEPGHMVAPVVDVVQRLVQWLNTFTHVVRRRQHSAVLQAVLHACNHSNTDQNKIIAKVRPRIR